MNWLDERDSCTCSCTLIGLPAQIPTELRRGQDANKTQTVILEVLTMPRPHTFFQPSTLSIHPTSPPDRPPARSPAFPFLPIIYYILFTCYCLDYTIIIVIIITIIILIDIDFISLFIIKTFYIVSIFILHIPFTLFIHNVACFPLSRGFWADMYIIIIIIITIIILTTTHTIT